jgi:hypothetical protein
MSTFAINNMHEFISISRRKAAESFCKNYTENLDDFVTLQQIEKIIINQSIGQNQKGCYLITTEIFDSIFEYIRNSIYQAGLAKLAASNKIECAWDDELNEMIFWLNSSSHGQQKINSLPSSE